MYEVPDEIWVLIKNFIFDYKKYYREKMRVIFENEIKCRFIPEYERWTYFQPWQNTNDIIKFEYGGNTRLHYAPPPNLELTSITWNVNEVSGGWWCGYGWKYNHNS